MKYFVWLILALPAVWELNELFGLEAFEREFTSPITRATGRYAGWLIILALCVTPLMRLTGGAAPVRFLKTHRRAIGVAAFFYSCLHTYVYALERGWLILRDSLHYSIWTGWLALALMLVLAATSNDAMQRRLGPQWKRIQRWSYAAAIITFFHWVLLHRGDLIMNALLSFAPLAALAWYRLQANKQRRRAR